MLGNEFNGEGSGWLKVITVFCGSKSGNNPIYQKHTEEVAGLLTKNGFKSYYYGGGNSGLMGAFQNAVRNEGAKITGVNLELFRNSQGRMPHDVFVEKIAHRKEEMINAVDGILTLPGGTGTLDEVFEVAVYNDLLQKQDPEGRIMPIVILNSNKIFEYQKLQLDRLVKDGFIVEDRLEAFYWPETPQEALKIFSKLNAQKPKLAEDLQTKHEVPVLSASSQNGHGAGNGLTFDKQ